MIIMEYIIYLITLLIYPLVLCQSTVIPVISITGLNINFDFEDCVSEKNCNATFSLQMVIHSVETEPEETRFLKLDTLYPEYLINNPSIKMLFPNYSQGHVMNNSCLIELHKLSPDLNIFNVSKRHENSKSETLITYPPFSREFIERCYVKQENVDAIFDLEKFYKDIKFENALRKPSELYVLKLEQNQNFSEAIVELDEMCKSFNFTHCKFMKDNWPYYFFSDPLSRSNDRIDFIIENRLRLQVSYVRNLFQCLPDNTKLDNGTTLHWTKTTRIHLKTSPLESCLDERGQLVERKCTGNLLTGAYLSDPPKRCFNEFSEKNISTETTSLPTGSIEHSAVDRAEGLYCPTVNFSGLTWERTLEGRTTTSKESCLDDEGKQVTRKCVFNGTIPFWSSPSGTCSKTDNLDTRYNKALFGVCFVIGILFISLLLWCIPLFDRYLFNKRRKYTTRNTIQDTEHTEIMIGNLSHEAQE